MERTREGGIMERSSSWKSNLYALGGIAWLVSWAGQVVWNGIGLLTSGEEYQYDGILDEDVLLPSSGCLQQAMQGVGFTPGCIELANNVEFVALTVGFGAFFWNPRLQERLAGRGVQIVGKRHYYFLQALLLCGRCASFLYLTQLVDRSTRVVQVVHASSLFLGLLVSSYHRVPLVIS